MKRMTKPSRQLHFDHIRKSALSVAPHPNRSTIAHCGNRCFTNESQGRRHQTHAADRAHARPMPRSDTDVSYRGTDAIAHRIKRRDVRVRASDSYFPKPQKKAKQAPIEPRFAEALQLAWAASRGRSLFAAKCLVSTALELHALGATANDVQSYLAVAGLEAGTSGALSDDARDVLTSWVTLISLTAEEAGYPVGAPHPVAASSGRPGSQRQRAASSGSDLPADPSSEDLGSGRGSLLPVNLGMRRFVKQVTTNFASGTRLVNLIEIQEAGGDPSPSVRLMQQNTRLVTITLELLEDCGYPVRLPNQGRASASSAGLSADRQADSKRQQLQQPQQQRAKNSLEPSTDSTSWVDPAQYMAAFPGRGHPQPTVRASAVKLLICHVGAMMGSALSASAFATEAARCYRAGFTASQLYQQLEYSEFKQQGGMVAVALTSSPHYTTVTAEVFSRWVAVVYMALAQLGVPRPSRDAAEGWAWAGGPSAPEAQATADFVTSTLRNGGAASGQALSTVVDSPVTAQVLSEAADQKLSASPTATAAAAAAGGFSTVKLEDPSLARTSPSVLAMAQQIDLVAFAAKIAQDGREQSLQQADVPDPKPSRLGSKDSSSRPVENSRGARNKYSRVAQASPEIRPRVPCPWPRRVNRRQP